MKSGRRRTAGRDVVGTADLCLDSPLIVQENRRVCLSVSVWLVGFVGVLDSNPSVVGSVQ